MTIEIFPVAGLPEIQPGDDIAELVVAHAEVRDHDILVVAQKIVSKAEGRLVAVDPARRDEERARWIASESIEVLARRGNMEIVRTHHGFVCANAGIDASNVPPDRLALLPKDPDASARAIRDRVRALTGAGVGVIVSDTFGRAWRSGQTNVALGVAGISPMRDHRGETDTFGAVLQATIIAVADEIAGAAELVMGKSDNVPVVVVRGLAIDGEGSGRDLVRARKDDLFPSGRMDE